MMIEEIRFHQCTLKGYEIMENFWIEYFRTKGKEVMTEEEYSKLEKMIKNIPEKIKDNMYSKVLNPLYYTSYEKMFSSLIEDEFTSEFGVNNNGKWLKLIRNDGWIVSYGRKEQETKDVKNVTKQMVIIASKNKFLKNCCEAKFQEEIGSKSRLTIEFTEYDGMIAGYKYLLPFSLFDMVDVKAYKIPYFIDHSVRRFYRNNGMWAPI